MYSASAAFHQAVKNREPQKPLFVFGNAVFSDMDIDVQTGIEFDDYFNTEEDLVVGQALSNEIRFTLFNDDRHLNSYTFGEFKALLGARVASETSACSGNVKLVMGGNTYIGSSHSPYLTKNGGSVGVNFPVFGLFGFNGNVYVYGADNETAVVSSGGSVSNMPAAMKGKNYGIKGQGYYYNGNKTLHHFHDGKKDTYEFVPLGVFIAERPKAPDQIRIDMVCHDRMQKFEKDMPNIGENAFPMSAAQMLSILCSVAGVTAPAGPFPNRDATITEKPTSLDTATLRVGIGWIAEIAGGNARFNRDGNLVFDWVRSTGQAFDEHDYSEFVPCWYETPRVDMLYNRMSDNGMDNIIGSGSNAYLVQDNPFLRDLMKEDLIDKTREKRQYRKSIEDEKLSYCINEDGEINFEKLLWMSDYQNRWAAESAEWDSTHPE